MLLPMIGYAQPQAEGADAATAVAEQAKTQTRTVDIDNEVMPLAKDLRNAARSAEAGFDAAKGAFDEATSVLEEDSPVRVELLQTLRSVSAAALLRNYVATAHDRGFSRLIRYWTEQ